LFAAGRGGRFGFSLRGWQAAQVANDMGFAKIRENPRFPLDTLRLYANLLCVKARHVWPGGDRTKTGLSQTIPRAIQGNARQSKPIQVIQPPEWKQYPGEKHQAIGHELSPQYYAKTANIQDSVTAKYAKCAKTELPLFAFFAWSRCMSFFFEPLSLFAANHYNCLSMNNLHAGSTSSRSNPIKPNQG
jgi:hypothetical protein